MTPDPALAAREAASVRKLPPADRDEAIAALARAFYDDPVFSFLLPDEERRGRQLQGLFDMLARRIWLRYDETYTTDAVVGGAFWVPPGEWHVSLLKQAAMGPGMVRRIGLREMPALLRALALIEKKHPREPHFYLPAIGVAPEWQGKGIGTALIRPMLDRCDSEGLPAYLEASSERNRACYERNGFEVREELRIPRGGPPLWAMWRPPASS